MNPMRRGSIRRVPSVQVGLDAGRFLLLNAAVSRREAREDASASESRRAERVSGGSWMLTFTTRLGRHINRRLRTETIIWLTTVDAHNTPQPRPVWFHWDGRTVLIFSERNKAKLRHIAQNPRVALSFNTDKDGDDVGVLIGDAVILGEPPPATRIQVYMRKYTEGIKDIGLTAPQLRESFAIPILVTPTAMRGL